MAKKSIATEMTEKQIKFAEALMSEEFKSDIERYRHAYPDTKMNDASVTKEASTLKKNPKIIEYIEERRFKALNLHTDSIKKKELIEETLLNEMSVGKHSTPASRIKAIELYMKFHNMFESSQPTPPSSVIDIIGKLVELADEAEKRAKAAEIKSNTIDIN